jgi:N6-adenosine-specific RNA methylase IME4
VKNPKRRHLIGGYWRRHPFPFEKLRAAEGYGAILADPAWSFKAWSPKGDGRSAVQHYPVMSVDDIASLPVADLAARDCALFLWATWPLAIGAIKVIERWGFTYKTCAFTWIKVSKSKGTPTFGNGYWTRSNSEVCLLATRGKPKRLHADVGQVILEPRREHSRKPACVHDRIERLVAGPYVELFAREKRRGWASWGNEV